MPYDMAPSEVFAEELEIAIVADDEATLPGMATSMAVDAANYGLSGDPVVLVEQFLLLRDGDKALWTALKTRFVGYPGVATIHRLYLECQPIES